MSFKGIPRRYGFKPIWFEIGYNFDQFGLKKGMVCAVN